MFRIIVTYNNNRLHIQFKNLILCPQENMNHIWEFLGMRNAGEDISGMIHQPKFDLKR